MAHRRRRVDQRQRHSGGKEATTNAVNAGQTDHPRGHDKSSERRPAPKLALAEFGLAYMCPTKQAPKLTAFGLIVKALRHRN